MQRTILRPEDVHERTGLDLETLKYWRKHGRGPRWFKLGRRVVYDSADVDAWIAEQREATGTAAQPIQCSPASGGPAAGTAPAPSADGIPAPRPAARPRTAAASTVRGRRARGRRS